MLSGGQLRNFADYSVEMLGLRNTLAPVLAPVLAPMLAPMLAPVLAPVLAPMLAMLAPVLAPVLAPMLAMLAPVLAPVLLGSSLLCLFYSIFVNGLAHSDVIKSRKCFLHNLPLPNEDSGGPDQP
jgi:hypothetical protein